jgi:hypothetical protein
MQPAANLHVCVFLVEHGMKIPLNGLDMALDAGSSSLNVKTTMPSELNFPSSIHVLNASSFTFKPLCHVNA